MDKEENLQVTRRTTRSLATAASSGDLQSHKRFNDHKPTVNDLVFGDVPISLDDLFSGFPGRRHQIVEILRLLGPLNSPMLPLFVYGGSSTGKTSVILQIFRHLRRPFVYTSCLTCYSPRILFESILNQLLLHTRNEENGYSNAKRCEKPSDFANFLQKALVNVLDILKGDSGKSTSKKSSSHKKGNMIYVIVDNLDRVRGWDKSSSILPILFGLHRTLKLAEVGIIFISKASPDTFYSNSGFMEPVPVHFPGYTEKDLCQIFMQKQDQPELYSYFLDIVLKPFFRITRRVDELSTAFSYLYQKYCEPLADIEIAFGGETKQKREDAKRRLFSHLQPHIAPSMNKISIIEVEGQNEKAKGKTTSRKSQGQNTVEELDFHMSTSAKYLLLSAFLASRNPATLDASLFDSSGGLDSRKKKRKCSEKALENKETAEQELLMKGPGTFALERMLAIFQCITSVAEISLDDEQLKDGSVGGGSWESELMSDILLQISSLCNANFIIKGGSCPLEGSTRYKCTVSEELALKVGRSLKFPLSKYLCRR